MMSSTFLFEDNVINQIFICHLHKFSIVSNNSSNLKSCTKQHFSFTKHPKKKKKLDKFLNRKTELYTRVKKN